MRRKLFAAALCLAVAGAILWLALHHPLAPETRAVPSPDRSLSLSVSEESGVTRIWLEFRTNHSRKMVADLGTEESAGEILWSPDSRLVAFQVFDRSGHSPMTTSHVLIVDPGSGNVRQPRLPAPNERFSTYLEGWVGNDSVKLRSTIVDRPDDLFFVYDYPSDSMHPAG